MKIKCKETSQYLLSLETYKASLKGLESMTNYLKSYSERTKDYHGKLAGLNSKYTSDSYKEPSGSIVDEYFKRLRIVIDGQVNSLQRIGVIVDGLRMKCESTISDSIAFSLKIQNDINEAEKNYMKHLKDFDKSKNEYHNDAAYLEGYLRNMMIKNRKGITKSQEDDYNDNKVKAIDKMIISEKDYNDKVNGGINHKSTFLSCLLGSTERMMVLISELEHKAKDTSYTSFLSLEQSWKDIDFEIKTYAPNIDKEIITNDSHIHKNMIIHDPLPDLPFENYPIKSLTKDNQEDYSQEELHEIIKTITMNMTNKTINYDIELEETKLQFNLILKKMFAFDSLILLTKAEMLFINQCIDSSKIYIEIFLTKLNNLRNIGKFSWPQEHYVEVGKVIVMILNASERDNDIITVQNVIILSQTFYFLSDDERFYLQVFIQEHLLLHTITFWKEYIMHSIEKELNDAKKSDIKRGNKDTEKESKMKQSNVVFSQLVHIIDNMLGFNMLKEDIQSILEEIFEQYSIKDQHKEMVFDVLKEKEPNPYSYSIKQEEKRDMIKNDIAFIKDFENSPVNEVNDNTINTIGNLQDRDENSSLPSTTPIDTMIPKDNK